MKENKERVRLKELYIFFFKNRLLRKKLKINMENEWIWNEMEEKKREKKPIKNVNNENRYGKSRRLFE